MEPAILCKSVSGAIHERRDMPCQDRCRTDVNVQRVILAAADGHGSVACPYSGDGAEIAVEVFCEIMADLWERESERMFNFLSHEGDTTVARAIEKAWKQRVTRHYQQNHGPIEDIALNELYKLYGTTLLGLVITGNFCFAFQLGDGDISYVDESGFQQLVHAKKLLGAETYSLCLQDAWRDAVASMRRLEEPQSRPTLYLLSTDGFFNSYRDDQEFQNTCVEYFHLLKENGPQEVEAHLKEWLKKTSELGSGDDITLVISYFGGTSEKADGKDNNDYDYLSSTDEE